MIERLEKKELVSICIPVYNGAAYIRETISSVLRQSYRPIEILVQDNASTDSTWQILQEIADNNIEVLIEKNPTNVGMAANWNIAIHRSHGEYISLLSADDLMLESFIERCVDLFLEDRYSVVTTNHWLLRDGKTMKRVVPCREGSYRYFAARVMLLNPFSINFSLFSRRFVDECYTRGPMFREDVYTCDYDLWLRIALAGEEVYYLEQPLGIYRIHGENLSTQTRRMQRHTQLVLTSHRRRYKGSVKIAYLFTLCRFLVRAYTVKNTHVDRRLVRALLLAMIGQLTSKKI